MKTLDSALRESANSIRDGAKRLPDRPWDDSSKRPLMARGFLVAFSAAAIVLVIFAVPVLISSLSSDPLETPPTVAEPSVQTSEPGPTEEQSDLIGEPVSDEEFRAFFPDVDLVPGSAHHLASSQVPGLGQFVVYLARLNGIAPQEQFDEPMTCVLDTGVVCGPDLDTAELRITGGSSCPPRQISVVGLDEGTSLVLEFTDGTKVEVDPTYGTATWGWNDNEVGLAEFSLSGASEATLQEFEGLKEEFYPDLPTQPCD